MRQWGMSIANAWRMSGDIYDSFTRPDDLCACDVNNPTDPFCIAPGTHCSVLFILNKVAPFADKSIPGGWSDLDMLEVGLGGMTDEEVNIKLLASFWSHHLTSFNSIRRILRCGPHLNHH